MRLLKFYLAFIVINALLVAGINRSVSGEWMFRLFLLTWMASSGAIVLILGYLADRFLSSLTSVFRLLTVNVLSFVLANLFMASLDPLQVGWLNNLVKTFTDSGTTYLIIVPFLASSAVTCVWCAFGARIYSALSTVSRRQTA